MEIKDKNGAVIQVGDVVRVSGAFFKNENGLWLVVHAPDADPTWCDKYCLLHRIGKRGKLAKGRITLSSWPLKVYVSSSVLRAEANEHNEKHAEIEIVAGDFAVDSIIEHFREKLRENAESIDYWYSMYGDSPSVRVMIKVESFYMDVIERVEARRAE